MIRVGVDVGGTFTDIVLEQTSADFGSADLRAQGVLHAGGSIGRRRAGRGRDLQDRRRLAGRHRHGAARHDGRHQYGDRAQGRRRRHDHHARLSRHPAHGASQAAAQFLAAVRRALAIEAAGQAPQPPRRRRAADGRRPARSKFRSRSIRSRRRREIFKKRGLKAVVICFLFSFLNNEHEAQGARHRQARAFRTPLFAARTRW